MTKKEIATDFLQLAAKGLSKKAFQLYGGENFKHHNPFFKGDADTLITAMEENARQNPNKIFSLKQVLEDGNLVATYSHIQQSPGELGAAVVHIFRFEAGKVVELWDVGQAVPAEMVNEHGMF